MLLAHISDTHFRSRGEKLYGFIDVNAANADLSAYSDAASVAAWATMEGRELAEESLSAGDWGVYHDFSEWAQIPARNLDRLGALAGSQQPREPGTRETAAGLLHALLESAGLLWD